MTGKSYQSAMAFQRTVELTTRDIEDAARLLALLVPDADRPDPIEPVLVGKSAQLVHLAKKLLAVRRLRSEHFMASMFGEPAWDMLLCLYVADARGHRLTSGRVVEQSETPASTGLRWLEYLESQQLVSRDAHPTDARVTIVAITDKARQAMESYLSEALARTQTSRSFLQD